MTYGLNINLYSFCFREIYIALYTQNYRNSFMVSLGGDIWRVLDDRILEGWVYVLKYIW